MTSRNALAAITLAAMLAAMSLATPAVAEAVEIDRARCIIKPRQVVQLGSPVFGVISELLVDRADPVRKGQILARLDSTVEQAQLALDRFRATSTTAVEAAQADLTWNLRELARRQRLAQNMLSRANDVDESETRVAQDRIAIRKGEIDLEIARLEARRTEAQLNLKTLRSPVDGVITEIRLSPGEYIFEQTPVLTIAQVDPLHVEVTLDASHYPKITNGQIGVLQLEIPVNRTAEVRVDAIDPLIDPASDTFRVRFVLPNPQNRIPAGTRCSVRLPDPKVNTRAP